ncbi:MAG: hypothetical protein K2X48_15760 [Chitinophagaceae bacterium]|nr:hypothetical protein [Chitinophagaceae bacterium]
MVIRKITAAFFLLLIFSCSKKQSFNATQETTEETYLLVKNTLKNALEKNKLYESNLETKFAKSDILKFNYNGKEVLVINVDKFKKEQLTAENEVIKVPTAQQTLRFKNKNEYLLLNSQNH